MEQIIVSCSKIEKTTFPCSIDDFEYASLTDYVHKVTRDANLPFSAQLTDLTDRKSLAYGRTSPQSSFCRVPSKLHIKNSLSKYKISGPIRSLQKNKNR